MNSAETVKNYWRNIGWPQVAMHLSCRFLVEYYCEPSIEPSSLRRTYYAKKRLRVPVQEAFFLQHKLKN